MTMADFSEQVPSSDSNRPTLQVGLENEGGSVLKPIQGFSSSRPDGPNLPSPLQLPHTGAIMEDSLSDPTFDLGLGCFGKLSRADDVAHELAPWWSGYDQAKIAPEFFDGRQVHGFEDIDLQSEEGNPDTDVSDDSENNESAKRISGGSEFLEELDNLEAARPKPKKRRHIPIPEGVWDKPNFPVPAAREHSDWIDEIAQLEESVSTTRGTRYYTVSESDESSNSDR
ncbi:hypothetical protein F5Y12DRAFT_612023 [Xylaria sp. FL1777]|nr:hypothetical protein F5Y12DRAFT_612023 [Xylaria sp. FL1777]